MENKTEKEIKHREEDLELLIKEFENRGFDIMTIRTLLQKQVNKLTERLGY